MSMKDKKANLRHACVLAVIVFCSISFFISGCNREQKSNAPAPPTVTVADVIQRNVPVYSEWIGTTDGMVNAVIRAQVQVTL